MVLSLAACSNAPLGRDVDAEAGEAGQIAFDLVKIDDGVLATLLREPPPAFPERFREYAPPPRLKIGVGDIVSVVIFEAAGNGLFGESLTEISLPPGAVTRRLLSPATPPLGSAAAALQELTPALGLSARLSGDADAQRLAAGAGLSAVNPAGPTGETPAAVGGAAQLSPGTAASRGALEPGGGLAAGAAFGGRELGGATVEELRARSSFAPSPRSNLGAETAANENLQSLLQAAVQSGRPGTRIPDQPVGPDGAISIPYAGRVLAAGRTPEEVQRAIEQRLAGKAIEPQALVTIRRNLANSVSVAGEMIGGARVALSPGGERLLQVIATAGGARVQQAIAGGGGAPAAVHDIFVQLSRGGVTATVPLATLIAHPEEDIYAEPGDVLTLVRRPQTYTVFGATGRNAAITFNSAKLSLAEALAKAGGLLDERADASAVFLFRYEPDSVVRALGQPIAAGAPQGLSPIAYRLDLRQANSYLLAKRFPVRDKDIIFAADAETHRLYKFFRALSQVVGPVETGLLTCINANC